MCRAFPGSEYYAAGFERPANSVQQQVGFALARTTEQKPCSGLGGLAPIGRQKVQKAVEGLLRVGQAAVVAKQVLQLGCGFGRTFRRGRAVVQVRGSSVVLARRVISRRTGHECNDGFRLVMEPREQYEAFPR
jgi:hypothetical protein